MESGWLKQTERILFGGIYSTLGFLFTCIDYREYLCPLWLANS